MSRKAQEVVAVAELYRRRAAVLVRAGERGGEAAQLLNHSLGLYRRQEGGSGLAEALLLQGCGGHTQGAVGLAEALYLSSPRAGLDQSIFDGALILLMEKLHESEVGLEDYESITRWILAASHRWFRRRSKCKRKLGLMWAEGTAFAKLGLGRRAEHRLSSAWLGFSRLGDYEYLAVTGMDLATVLIGHDERDLALEILQVSRERVHRQCADGELEESLKKAEDLSLMELDVLRASTARRWLPSTGDVWWSNRYEE